MLKPSKVHTLLDARFSEAVQHTPRSREILKHCNRIVLSFSSMNNDRFRKVTPQEPSGIRMIEVECA